MICQMMGKIIIRPVHGFSLYRLLYLNIWHIPGHQSEIAILWYSYISIPNTHYGDKIDVCFIWNIRIQTYISVTKAGIEQFQCSFRNGILKAIGSLVTPPFLPWRIVWCV